MGSMQASEMARLTDLDTALSWHLSSNHYPPVPASMVPVCKAALQAYEDEEYDREITLPKGVFYKGRPTAPAHAVFDAHHLESFLHVAEDFNEEEA